MRRYSIFYFFGQSIKGLWRNGVMTIASVTVLMSCLMLMGSFALLVYNIDANLNEIASLNEIVVAVDYEATSEQIAEISAQIDALDNIQSVTHVTKEEALENERERYGEYAYLFDELDENPLSDSFLITYKSNDGVSTLVYNLGQIDGVRKVTNRMDIAQSIESVKNGISFVFLWFLAVLFIVSIFIIINTVKLAVESRSREITAMRYVGATNFFMAVPFVLEGALIGLVSAGIGFLIEWYMYNYVYQQIMTSYRMFTVVEFSAVSVYTPIGFVAVGVFAGILGSCISLRKYMRV